MKIRFTIPAAILAAALAAESPASTPEAARQQLEQAVNQVTALAVKAQSSAQLAKDVRPVLEKHLNFSKMTQRAIGPGWREFTPAQREEATRLFTTLIIRNYCDKYTLGENPTTQYRAAQQLQAGRVEIPTRILYRGSNYEVIYRMEDAGGWKITDIVVEGVSFVANYRAQFDAHFKRGGAAAVLEALRSALGNPS